MEKKEIRQDISDIFSIAKNIQLCYTFTRYEKIKTRKKRDLRQES